MSGTEPKRPTLAEVARKAGVHRTTVSLALRGHPRIPKKTRDRIRRIAGEVGYVPNPLLSVLMSARAAGRRPAWKASLLWLTSHRSEDGWRRGAYSLIFQGAEEKAKELGYSLEPIWVHHPGFQPDKFHRTLRARNIPGVVVAPSQEPRIDLTELQWDRISSVAIGYSLQDPDLHRVTTDYFHSISTAYRKAFQAGYRRIGYITHEELDEKVDHLWLSAYLMEQRLHPDAQAVPPLILRNHQATRSAVASWLRKERPDAVISLPQTMLGESISKAKRRVPDDLAWISLGSYDRSGEMAGIFQPYQRVGAVAVEHLVAMINRGERGVPVQSIQILVKGEWINGKTMRSRPVRAATVR